MLHSTFLTITVSCFQSATVWLYHLVHFVGTENRLPGNDDFIQVLVSEREAGV